MRLLTPALSRLPCVFFAATFSLAPLACVPWHAAHAQSADEAEAEQEAMDAQKKAEARKAARHAAPPSVLPGADSDDSDESHARMDLNPTNALFDAVNRGSLMAAKEALNRGADMNAHNALDQTALDLAIDLGRRDIMFLLLSLRSYNADDQVTADASHGAITTTPDHSHIKVNGEKSAPETTSTRAIIDDGGQPQPEMGFLGFGPTRNTSHRSAKPSLKKKQYYTGPVAVSSHTHVSSGQ